MPWALRALADRLVRLCAGVGEDLEDDPMMNEMFRAESANDMRRLTVSAFVAFAICPALPRCRNVRMGRGRCGCAHAPSTPVPLSESAEAARCAHLGGQLLTVW